MNFFERQDRARRKTGLLIFYFAICVLFIIACVYLATSAFHYYYSSYSHVSSVDASYARSFWDLRILAGVAGVTLIIVILGSIYKIAVLGRGGDKIAGMLGGRAVSPDTNDPDERRLLNVVEAKQLVHLSKHADRAVLEETGKILPEIRKAGPEYRLPLIDMAIPALKNLSDSQHEAFRSNVKTLIEADDQLDIHEFLLEKILIKNLDPSFKDMKPGEVKFRHIYNLRSECRCLLSVLASLGNESYAKANEAFDESRGKLGLGKIPFEMLDSADCTLENLNKALDRLTLAIGATLDCPVPPLTG